MCRGRGIQGVFSVQKQKHGHGHADKEYCEQKEKEKQNYMNGSGNCKEQKKRTP